MIKWDEPYTSRWRVVRVNEDTWSDSDAFELAISDSINISKDATDSVPLLQSCRLSIKNEPGTEFEPGWYRIILTAIQNNEYERISIGTFIFESYGETYDYNRIETSLNGYSVLKPASDLKLPVGTYAPKGIDAVEYCAELLRKSGPAPVSISSEEPFILTDHVVFDVGSSYLEAVWLLLDSGGWCMQIDGDGVIYILKKPDEIEFEFNINSESLFGTKFVNDRDISSVPNRYYATDGYILASATNEDENSPTSYQARGRWIDAIDTSPILVDGETLDNYAERRLIEESTIMKQYTYNREFVPGLEPFDMVRCSEAKIGMVEDGRIMSQTFTCSHGIYLTETIGVEEVEYGG